jgi:ribonuclease P protein component
LALAECEDVRVAYSISRKVGGAVIRNHWRRRVRAIVANTPEPLVPGAYLISLAPDVTQLTYDELRDRVIETMQRASQGSR